MSTVNSRCGMDCGTCPNREECGCVGCFELAEGDWAGDCDVKKCCEEKLLEHCGLCVDFPCDLLRNTAFDPDEGDDGERLITLKRWAEEKPEVKRKSRSRVILGFAAGAALGGIFGALTGSFGAVMFACVLVGTAIGVFFDITKNG